MRKASKKREPTHPESTPPAAARERFEEQTARIAAALVLADLSDHERAFLAGCQKIYRQETGCNTPFEEFFISLVIPVQHGWLPTPDHVAHDLETFRQNWDDMKRDASRFLEAYPEKETAHA